MTAGGSVVDRITAVIDAHRKSWYVQSGVATCTAQGCDWSRFGTITVTNAGHAAHVAGEVAKALQLTEDLRRINPQTRAKPCDDCGHLKGVHAEPCAIGTLSRPGPCGCPEYHYTPPETSWESRLVSPWVPVPQEGDR